MSDAQTCVKVTKEEAAEMDPKLQGGTVLPQASAEVEAQFPYCTRVMCPWCCCVLRIIADTSYFKWFVCASCGGTFRF